MMMDLSHSLTLNEEALQQLPSDKRPHFVFEWLLFLDKVLTAAQKSDIKGCQQKLVSQLTALMQEGPGAPARALLARCLSTLFSVGDTFMLFDTVNVCNDILKNKDDSPSYLPVKLAAVCCLGSMYERLGRMMGRSYEETINTLVRCLKSAETQMRVEIIITLEKIGTGMGTAAYGAAARGASRAARAALSGERGAARGAAARALKALLPLNSGQPASASAATPPAASAAAAVRALDTDIYQVRMDVAEFLGALLASTQVPETPTVKGQLANQSAQQKKDSKSTMSLEETLNILMSGFLRGGNSFLKGEIIKSGSGVNREVRVGITHAYMIFVQTMGGLWLERNMSIFLSHVLDLVANPKAASSHVDAVYSRKCINYILRSTIGKMLGEKAQASACKDIIQIIVKQMNSIDFNPENAKDCNQETLFSQHLLVCALTEISELVLTLGTSAQNLISEPSVNMIDAVWAVLIHPCAAARLAAAWCLRCICIAVPAHLTQLIDKCIEALDSTKTSPEAILGYGSALAAALGAVRLCAPGVPHGRGKVAFNAAEQLLRSAGHSSRLSAARTNTGWLIVAAICTMGVPVVRSLLPRMMLLWRNSFPRSAKELESERARGDAFTWQVTLEGRAGALAALHSLLVNCPSLVDNDETSKRLAQPIEGALAVLASIRGISSSSGNTSALAAGAALLRLRVCEVGALRTPPASPPLLRALAADLTLAESVNSPVATGLLMSVGHPRDAILLGIAGWIGDTDHAEIEEQLLSPLLAVGSGALEHDPCCLYRPLPPDQTIPGPLPLGVAVIDASVLLFGQIFPKIANKHRLQMMEHFAECIKQSKNAKQEAIQINVYTALLLGLKGLSECKAPLGQDDVRNSAMNLVVAGLSSTHPWARCLSAACAGRLWPAPTLADRLSTILRQTTAGKARAGAAAALGAVQRARGAVPGAAGTALPTLLSLAQDMLTSDVQVWSLHALSLIADAGGPMFRSYVEPTLTMALKLLLQVPPSQEEVHKCIAKLLSALITAVGPELQGNTPWINSARGMFLCGCVILGEVGSPAVQAEAIACLQQLHLFAPRHLNLSTLVPMLCRNLSSKHLVMRRAALCCMRQLCQREAAEVCRHALLTAEADANNGSIINESRECYYGIRVTETGLPAALFAILDVEHDSVAIQHARDALLSCLSQGVSDTYHDLSDGQNSGQECTVAVSGLRYWISLCKKVLGDRNEDSANTPEMDMEAEGDDDQAEFHAGDEQSTHPSIQPRWPTRVFAMECIQKIMTACESAGEAHFNLLLAKEQQMTRNNVDYLVLHVAELVRLGFCAATGEVTALRLAGLATLQRIVLLFGRAEEPELPGHLLLEQFQAQVGAALRPAFSPDTPALVTAAACDVCSAWIGSGVARDLNDLRRVHQLLVSGLHKLNTKANTALIYNESMATLEKLSILKAWAEVYIVAMIGNGTAPGSSINQLVEKSNLAWSTESDRDFTKFDDGFGKTSVDDDFGSFEFKGESLLKLVEPELEGLANNWFAALKDHALLSLPPEFGSQLPHAGGAFYRADTADASRPHYVRVWPSLMHAASLYFNISPGDVLDGQKKSTTQNNTDLDDNKKTHDLDNVKETAINNNNCEFMDPADGKFHLLFGICMEALCAHRDTTIETTTTCLLSILTLLDSARNRARLVKDRSLAIELCHVLHRTGLTQQIIQPLLLAVEVLYQVITAASEDLDKRKTEKLKALTAPINPETESDNSSGSSAAASDAALEAVLVLGEGGPTGELPPGKSLVFSCLEVALCLAVRRAPYLSPRAGLIGSESVNGVVSGEPGVAGRGLGPHSDRLLGRALACMAQLPALCSPQGALSIFPTLLYLGTLSVRESEAGVSLLRASGAAGAALPKEYSEAWGSLLNSALAKLVDMVKNDESSQRLEPIIGMKSMAALISFAPNAPPLHFPCINYFRQCVESDDPNVVLVCCESLRLIWASSSGGDGSAAWARSLSPRILAWLGSVSRMASGTTDDIKLTPTHISAVQACIAALEAIINTAPSDRQNLLNMLTAVVIAILQTDLVKLPPIVRQLHNECLQWLMKVAPKHPQEFKALMTRAPTLRAKLETAIRANQLAISVNQAESNAQNANANDRMRSQNPSIQLRTDFSNFKIS